MAKARAGTENDRDTETSSWIVSAGEIVDLLAMPAGQIRV